MLVDSFSKLNVVKKGNNSLSESAHPSAAWKFTRTRCSAWQGFYFRISVTDSMENPVSQN